MSRAWRSGRYWGNPCLLICCWKYCEERSRGRPFAYLWLPSCLLHRAFPPCGAAHSPSTPHLGQEPPPPRSLLPWFRLGQATLFIMCSQSPLLVPPTLFTVCVPALEFPTQRATACLDKTKTKPAHHQRYPPCVLRHLHLARCPLFSVVVVFNER